MPNTPCPGGDKCRSCTEKFCRTIHNEQLKGLTLVGSGERTVKEQHEYMVEKYPTKTKEA